MSLQPFSTVNLSAWGLSALLYLFDLFYLISLALKSALCCLHPPPWDLSCFPRLVRPAVLFLLHSEVMSRLLARAIVKYCVPPMLNIENAQTQVAVSAGRS